MLKKIFCAFVFIVLFTLHVSALAESNVYYDISKLSDYDSTVDTTAERLSVSYLPKKGNKIKKTGNTFYVDRSVDNSIDCFAELQMPDRFTEADSFVIDFVFEPVQIGTSLRIFRANQTSGGSSYDFISIHPGSDTPARLKILGRAGYIPLPAGETRISLCVGLSQKKADVYIGDSVVSDVSLNIDDNMCIRSFWIGTNSGGGATSFYIKDAKIYGGTTPSDTTDFPYIRPSVMDKNDGAIKARKILGSSMAFSESVFYFDGNKLDPNEVFGSSPYIDNGVLMIPRTASKLYLGETVNSVKNKIIFSFGTAYTGDMFYTRTDGTIVELSSPIVIKGSDIFVPLVDMCKALDFNYYEDSRGFVVVNKENAVNLSNSPVTYKNAENSDVIHRFLHFDRPSGSELVDKIKSLNHTGPAFLVDSSRLAQVMENINTNSDSTQMAAYTIAQADAILGLPCVEYKYQDSIRLLDSCQSVKSRMQKLCPAYLISSETERDKYAQKIWAELQNCLNWQNWNTNKHFLDSGMLAPGVALAYDTLREYLTDSQKEWVRERVYDLYLDFCIKAYQGAYSGSEFRYSTTNWGAVCSGGIISICLAFAPDVEGDYRTDVEYLIENAMHSMEFPASMLFPDGAWPEGVGYGGFVGEFLTSFCIAPLVNYYGSDCGFLSLDGYEGLYEFPLTLFGPAGIFNYSSNAWTGKPYYGAYAYQAALLSDNSAVMSVQKTHRKMFGGGTSSMDVLWYEPSMYDPDCALPQDIYYSGAGIGVMRNSYEKESASYVGICAGVTDIYGSHFDKGSFIYDCFGVRWAMDLGFDNYNVEGGYHGESGSTLYRKRTEGHNCVVINPTSDSTGQLLNANTYLERSDFSDGSGYMIYNLTEAYADNVNEYKRGFYLGDGRETLLVRDEISLKKESDIYWFMHTEAEILLDENKKGATLIKEGREMRVMADCSVDGWYFEVREAEPFDESMKREGEYSREGITKLSLIAKASGDITITVKLAPLGINTFEPLPLSVWECEKNYTPPPVSDIRWSKGKITFDINNDFTSEKAFVATYSGSSLQSINRINLKESDVFEISDEAHTKIFFWNDLIPQYRYYEFNLERK